MILLENMSKTYLVNGHRKIVAKNINATFPTGSKVALLGRNGAGKSSMLRLLSGVMNPDSGRIIHHGSVSWPVGFAGSFSGDLTGAQNARFVARTYGVDADELSAYAEDFAELGIHYHLPFRTYSSGMRSRLAFGVSMGIPFDTYLVDEVTSVGDVAFRTKSQVVFKNRLETSGAIVVSHSLGMLRRVCTSGAVLERGRLRYFDALEDAIDAYHSIIGHASKQKT